MLSEALFMKTLAEILNLNLLPKVPNVHMYDSVIKMTFLWKPERDKNYFLRSNNLFDYIHTIGVWNWQQHLLAILNCPIHTTAGKLG